MAFSRPLRSPRRSVLIAIAGVVLYTLLVGAGASVVRAGIMGSLALISVGAGRAGHAAHRPALRNYRGDRWNADVDTSEPVVLCRSGHGQTHFDAPQLARPAVSVLASLY